MPIFQWFVYSKIKEVSADDFDSTQHLHLGYYEDHFDLEATAYKLQGDDKGVVFWENKQQRFPSI
ncbi:DUF3986 family protein [Mesobacillus zeae]|uniref:DUF3986 family protein n=1 Tax=Mesobacillus zeae TaxID=1917180 RepID=UPI002175201E|nr:DUF3986 family protein [Mesobacillus zeae]